ncbi:hypothetical protein DFP74_0871 [Nocardiopsis sp. Huas11]|uniref:hypothetical protein n=1 Tax=Nocardiopsis sp. Huas11 TaxID=2183912 RepID=UPI000EB41709|nr:hypothetical protein [Nocardiopsis sp. Huas11]RKS05277.1 hypothetical protein DFP74_0871 [Nocardiopsis sp. Huas11]
MPRALRVLRALFSLKATLSALTFLFVAFLLLSLYFYTPPGYREWLAELGVSVPRLWGWALMYLLGTIAYTAAAVLLGKGGRDARDTVLVILALDALVIMADTAMLLAGDPLVDHWVVGVMAWTFVVVPRLLVPALFLLLLTTKASRAWLRATD